MKPNYKKNDPRRPMKPSSNKILDENRAEILQKIREVLTILFGRHAEGISSISGDAFKSADVDIDDDSFIVTAEINIAGVMFRTFKFELVPEFRLIEIRRMHNIVFWNIDFGSDLKY
jgi:hypothetical protein